MIHLKREREPKEKTYIDLRERERERERERDKRRNKKLIENKGLGEKWGLTTEVEWTIEATMAVSEEVKRGTERGWGGDLVYWDLKVVQYFILRCSP